MEYPEAAAIKMIVDSAGSVVIVQADNPDVDSLGSALALESILGSMGKEVYLYCGVDIPGYLHYLPGWGRVNSDMPKHFDAAFIVDTSSDSLLQQLDKTGSKGWLAAKPTIVLDHHQTESSITFADVTLQPAAVATGEIIYELAQQLGWQLDSDAKNLLAMAILSDSLGLMSQATTARSIKIIAELVEGGVSLPELESARRQTLRRETELIGYKGRLLQRAEFFHGDRIGIVDIPWDEIEKYSPLYNPSMLVIDDIRLGKNTEVAICFKIYRAGKITAKIRCNYGWGIADKLAEQFGGGGHPLAAGFKINEVADYQEVKDRVIKAASEMIDEIEKAAANETV